jgi:hypothetical protein
MYPWIQIPEQYFFASKQSKFAPENICVKIAEIDGHPNLGVHIGSGLGYLSL